MNWTRTEWVLLPTLKNEDCCIVNKFLKGVMGKRSQKKLICKKKEIMKIKPTNDNAEWKRKYIQAMPEKQDKRCLEI